MSAGLQRAAKGRLRWTPLLSQLTDEQFATLVDSARIVDLRLGDTVGFEPGEALSILVEGRLRLVADNDRGVETTVCTFKNRGAFWTGTLLKDVPAPHASLRASEDSTYLSLDEAQMEALAGSCPEARETVERESRVLGLYARLRDTGRFSNVDFDLLKPFLLAGQTEPFKAGDRFPERRATDGLFILISGAVDSEKNGSTNRLKEGDWFCRGKIFASREDGNENIIAVESGEGLWLPEPAYRDIRQAMPEIASGFDGVILGSSGEHRSSEVLAHIDAPGRRGDSAAAAEPRPAAVEDTVPKLRRYLHKYPVVYQPNELECGITCLHMICLFYGKKVSLSQLRDMCEIGRSGTSMLDLAEAAEQLGFMTRGVRTTYGGLLKLKPPLICFWKQNHFVVLYEINANEAIIGDPGTGLEKIDRQTFTRDFSEHALELTPSPEFGQNIESRPFLATFLPIIEPHRALARDIVASSIVYQVLMLVTPIFTQVVLDQVIVHQDLDMLTIMLIGMLLFTLLMAIMGFIRQFLLEYLALKVDMSLFSELFKRMLGLPFTFFDKHSTGDLLTRFGESSAVVQFLAGHGALAVLDLIMAVLFLLFVFFYNITFGIITTIYVLCLTVLVACCMPYLKRLSQRAYDKQIAAESFLVEAIRGIERVKSAAAERRTRWKWELLFVDKLNVRFQESVANSAVSAMVHMVQVGGQVAVLYIGAHMVIDKSLSIGQLMAVNMLVAMIANPFIRLAELSYAFQNVSVALERLSDVLTEKPEEPDAAGKIHTGRVEGRVRFEKVTYRYQGRESVNALTNVSFEAEPGQMIGIVGRTGSGKTTLIRLIQGLYLPTEGRIYVDGNDLARMALSNYRQHIGVVSQHDYYFRGTIRDNISFYRPDATMEEIVRACTVSGANEFISALPSGYETVLTEGAANFSGGQRQCMAVARSILHHPSVLIFDEATSGMDSETESRIQHCMETLRSDCTMFVVAHRLSTIRSADLILVMDRGSIVETGTHESLLREKGLYYYLCQQQSLV
ncbi:MAG: ABC transporter transmembrane domain-containing protein [Candidatus Obscuribacterales bacterium]